MVDLAKEFSKGATSASEKIGKAVTDIVTKNGGSSVGPALDQLKKAVIGGGSSFNLDSLGLPGVDAFAGASFNSIVQSTKDLPLAAGFELGQTKVPAPPNFKPPLPNQLSQYASVNTIFTLSVLSDEAINFPDLTYKKGQLGTIILKSANGTAPENLVKTAYGSFNFYIDNFKMTTIVGLNQSTGVSNATNVSFTVIEPYSMGLFFQAVQLAALQAGTANYTQVPLLLTMEWKGWTDLNQETAIVTRQIPLKLRQLSMQVSGKGCQYEIEAYPWNEQGLSKTFNEVKGDIGIQCDRGKYTIQNLLQTGENSLQEVLNKRFKELKKKEKVDVPDEILILFPNDTTSDPSSQGNVSNESSERSATVSPGSTASADAFYSKLGVSQGNYSTKVQNPDSGTVNLIGQGLMGFSEKIKGETPFAKDADSYDKEKGIVKIGSVTIDLNNSKFHFAQGALITDIITNVILNSDYGRNALNKAQETPSGDIVWFRIESQVFNIPQEDSKRGTKPKCIVYRVVPYTVSSSRFLPPDSKTPGLEKKKQQALKKYDYIYTGQNTEILNFNITFEAGFYTAMNAGTNSEGDRISNNTGQSTDPENRDETPGSTSSGGLQNAAQVLRAAQGGGSKVDNPTQVRYDKTESKTAKLGGAGPYDDKATEVARQFHDVITSQVDMINLELEILGDPYYIADSGMGNYSAKETQGYENITGDGSMNYQNGEVVVEINFRTPVDINLESGTWDFGNTEPIASFSGLFRVLSVDNNITRNKFVQTLHLVRLPGQEPTKVEKPTASLSTIDNEGSQFVQATNNSILNSPIFSGSTVNQTNNTNQSAPNVGLPGVVNSGGFTI